MNLATLFQQSKQSFWEFWAARDAREHLMLTAGAVAAGLGLIYLVLIDPALTGRAQTHKNIPLLRQQVAQMQAMAKEATAFLAPPTGSSSSSSSQATLSRELILATMTGKGLPIQNVTVSGDQVTVQFATASFAATLAWLDEIQKSARLAVVEANIVALDQPDMVNAKLTLRQARIN